MKGGHQIPARPASAQMIQGGKFSRRDVGRIAIGSERHDQAKLACRRRHPGQNNRGFKTDAL